MFVMMFSLHTKSDNNGSLENLELIGVETASNVELGLQR